MMGWEWLALPLSEGGGGQEGGRVESGGEDLNQRQKIVHERRERERKLRRDFPKEK